MKIDMEARNLKTWVPYQSARDFCKGCQAGCCTLPVVVTSEELFHLGFVKAFEVEGPLKRVFQRLKKQGVVRSFNSRSRLFTLKRKEGNACVFLDEDRLCTVYERRPSVCRRFPLGSARPGFCPKILKPRSADLGKKIGCEI